MATASLNVISARIVRLADWILEEERNQGGHGHVTLAGGKRTLSSRLGIPPKALSHYLAGLSAHGVRGGRREIIIADREALQGLLSSFRAYVGVQGTDPEISARF
jgi:hypothetical protein